MLCTSSLAKGERVGEKVRNLKVFLQALFSQVVMGLVLCLFWFCFVFLFLWGFRGFFWVGFFFVVLG